MDNLELRIVEALQIDGRASWRKIASALGENERTVARRGSEMLASGVVSVAAIHLQPASILIRARCTPGTIEQTLEALASRGDTSFVYAVTGPSDVVAELLTTPEAMGQLITKDLPTTPGVVNLETYPALKFYRTIGGWRLGVLSEAEAAAMGSSGGSDTFLLEPMAELDPADASILECLQGDGRMGFEELGKRVGLSESTARRRVESLLSARQIQIRALIEPRSAGLPVEALIWFRLSPQRIATVADSLMMHRKVRYAAVIAGGYQLLVDVTVKSMNELNEFLSNAEWVGDVDGIETSLIIGARKRGGRVVPL
ncbi:Lrp/AsnC family transcriptional regulator [Arthrobacter sp. Marseille-P9274]|uniref:Lrp/AsnC family transcriptional regulator n=1 Tax=Arthrobacter sp. Marseille-P9274 TaxID=2866572 RepID=UPI0021C811CD|nr:Lrp/AsnC family transcriptional regulator [Arthrobacter sp. Marseille-P9274]